MEKKIGAHQSSQFISFSSTFRISPRDSSSSSTWDGISKISKITHTGPTLLGRGFPRRRNSREDGSIERSRNRRGFMHNASILFSIRFRDTPRSIISRVNSTEPDNGDKRVSVPMIHGARSVSRRHSFQKNSFALVVASSRTHYTDEPINFRP